MILTCPECATRYFVRDGLVGPGGRKVRCAACGGSWRASAEDEPLELSQSPEEGALARPAAPPAAPRQPDIADLPGAQVPRALRDRAKTRRRLREAAAQGALWAGAAAVLALLAGTSVVFRADMVRLWPKTASAYAAIGLPVNTVGLVIEQVKAEPALKDGEAAVRVVGVLRNVAGGPVESPPLTVSLLDKAGKTVARKVAAIEDAPIPAGRSRPFAVDLDDPPAAAADVEVAFVLEPGSGLRGPPRLRRQAPPPPAEARPAPPAVAFEDIPEARPLAPDSPDALPAREPAHD